MNPLDGFVQEITNGLQSAKDFAGAQLPEIAMQAVRFEIASRACYLVIAILVLCGCYRVALFINEKAKEEKNSDWNMCFVPVAIVCFVSFLVIVFDLQVMLKAIFAPKIYLLEYAAHLVRSCK